MTNQRTSRIEQYLWPEGFRRDVWMIVDAARDRRIFPILQELRLEYYCLYSGPLPPALETAAPYLVQLDYDDEDAHRFLRHAWGKNWGVLLKCNAHVNTLRGHLRGFLVVRDPDGNRLVFRYYDPRVLSVYLPTCVEEELRSVFGPIECFWTEGGNSAENILEFRLRGGSLLQSTLSLALDAPPAGRRLNTPESGPPGAEVPHQRRVLTIRREQMAVFVESEIKKFEDSVVLHLHKFFPRKYEALGERKTRQMIRHGIKQAASYNIRAERDVCKYIDLMFRFGRDFDRNDMLSWPRRILNDQAFNDPTVKMENLYRAARQQRR